MSFLSGLECFIDSTVALIPRAKPSPRAFSTIQLVAHRGAHDRDCQENTLAAFDKACELGCYGIEFDVQPCADGTLVVNHDPTLKRLWDKDLSLANLNFATLRQLVPDLPSLAEVIERYAHRIHLFIELKTSFTQTEQLVALLRHLNPGEDYHLLSLEESILPYLAAFPKNSILLVPEHHNVRHFCHLSLQKKYGGVLGHYLLMRNGYVNALQAEKQLVGVGFVNSKFSLYRETARNIPLIFTNEAATVSAYLKTVALRATPDEA